MKTGTLRNRYCKVIIKKQIRKETNISITCSFKRLVLSKRKESGSNHHLGA